MLQIQSLLAEDIEPVVIHWGQSNAQPNGTQAEGFAAMPNLDFQVDPGVDLTITAGFVGGAGTQQVIAVVSPALVFLSWVGAEIRLGTVGSPRVGYGVVVSNTTNQLTVRWNADFNADTTAATAWLVRPGEQWKTYPSVRVLVPYMPETPGAYPAGPPVVPGYSFPSTITSYADCGVFVPFSFLEGVNGPGAVGTSTGTAPTTMTDSVAAWTANLFGGGYVRCGGSKARIRTNTGTVLTLDAAGWIGGTPPAASAYEIHTQHWRDNPAHYDPGYGFRVPANCGMAVPILGQMLNRPGGFTTPSFSADGFGMALPMCWRLSALMGRRVNLIHLAVGASGMLPSNVGANSYYPGVTGWWDDEKALDWTPAHPGGLADRLARMISPMAPGALAAEGSTKRLRVVGICGMHGETDSTTAQGRATYRSTLGAFYSWLRGAISAAGLSPYAVGARIPVVHPRITAAWAGLDSDEEVNAAIEDFAARDGFAATFETDSAPRKIDGVHFNGAGEVQNATRAADAMARLITLALSFGVR